MNKVRILQQNTNIDLIGNSLGVASSDGGVSVSSGRVEGKTYIHKFGYAPDFDTGDLSVTIWDGADDGNIDLMNYNYSTTADIVSIASNKAADTQEIEIQGLKTGYVKSTQTVTLTGTGRVALATTLIRVFRMKNTSTTSNTGHVYCYTSTSIASGIPTVKTHVRAILQPKENQTLMALYTVPAGQTAYLQRWKSSIAGANKTANYIIDLKARPFGQCFQLKDRSSISDDGSSRMNDEYDDPEKFAEKTDIELKVKIATAGITVASISGGFDLKIEDN